MIIIFDSIEKVSVDRATCFNIWYLTLWRHLSQRFPEDLLSDKTETKYAKLIRRVEIFHPIFLSEYEEYTLVFDLQESFLYRRSWFSVIDTDSLFKEFFEVESCWRITLIFGPVYVYIHICFSVSVYLEKLSDVLIWAYRFAS